MLARGCVVFLLMIAGGCAPPRTPASVTHPDASVKIRGIKRSVRQGDRSVLPYLVADLDSDDPAVRFYAIEALQQLTGEDLGYRYYDDLVERQPAIERWKAWLQAQP